MTRPRLFPNAKTKGLLLQSILWLIYTQDGKCSSGFHLPVPVVASVLDDHPLPVARRTVHFKFLSQLYVELFI